MNDEIVIRWRKSVNASPGEPEVTEQRRMVVDRGGSLWAIGVEDVPTRWLDHFAYLQHRHYVAGLKTGPFHLPASNIQVARAEAHPLALYMAAEEISAALATMGHPRAVTVADVATRFPALAAPRWLRECGDADFVDIAMDAAGYMWTHHRIGPNNRHMAKTRYVFVFTLVQIRRGR